VGSDEAAPSTPKTIKLLMDEKRHPEEPSRAHKDPKPVWTGQVIERKERERNNYGHRPGKEQEAVEFAHLPLAGCLAPEKARINRVSQRPPKGARRGIRKIVLPTHSDDTWGEDAPQHAHHHHFLLREKKRPPEFGGLSLRGKADQRGGKRRASDVQANQNIATTTKIRI